MADTDNCTRILVVNNKDMPLHKLYNLLVNQTSDEVKFSLSTEVDSFSRLNKFN